MEPYQQLEREWAECNQLEPAGMVACSSGTAALHLALESLRLPPNSEVIVPDLTMIACPRAVTLAGLTPVFMDCDSDLSIDFTLLPRGNGITRCIMPVHIYGRRCDLEMLNAWRDNWPSSPTMVVEDLAEAHGVRPHPRTDAACWSFYKNKIIAGEEGGAVWFRDLEHAKLARQLRSLGFTDAHDFTHVPRGHNYRMSNLHADLIIQRLRMWVAGVGARSDKRRREVEGWYEKHCPKEWRMPPRDAPWVYDLRIPKLTKQSQVEVVGTLNKKGLAARLCFQPMRWQEEYKDCRIVEERWPVPFDMAKCERASQEVFYLPIQPGLITEETAKDAFETIMTVLR